MIDRSLVRSFVCPPVRLCLRSIVRTIICSLVRPFAHPFDRTCVCPCVLCLLRSFNFSFVPLVFHLLLYFFAPFSFVLLIVCPPFLPFLPTFERKERKAQAQQEYLQYTQAHYGYLQYRHSSSTVSAAAIRMLAVLWIINLF